MPQPQLLLRQSAERLLRRLFVSRTLKRQKVVEGILPATLADEDTPSEVLRHLEVFNRWIEVMNELRDLGLIRSTNSAPLGGYAEVLVARRFKTKPLTGQDHGYDLIRADDIKSKVKVQVKARRDPGARKASHFDITQLGDRRFDELVGVVFNHDFSVRVAWQMPWKTVDELARPSGRKHRVGIRAVEKRFAAGDETIKELDLNQRT